MMYVKSTYDDLQPTNIDSTVKNDSFTIYIDRPKKKEIKISRCERRAIMRKHKKLDSRKDGI